MKKNNENPIILLGFQRSGTTVFAHKLSEAFDVDNGLFSVNGKLMYYLQRWLTMKDIDYRHLRVDEILFSLKRRVPGGIGIERYLYQVEKVLREVAIDVAEGYQGNELELGRRIVSESYKGFTRWGDKYNEYLQIFSYLNNVVPDAKYILMFRDPYDVASSVIEWEGDRPWRPLSVPGNLTKWVSWHSEAIEQITALSKERYLVVEYQRLCEGIENDRLSNFIGIEIAPYLKELVPRRKRVEHPRLTEEVKEVWDKLQRIN
ncbi:sulfotransferase [Paenibacillus sp. FSL R7-0313]|uniref:sulfotransferase n=1 Tax=Paenibacillus sp. FSL R7-0313 TaxID=2954532 RepID=UPI0030DD8D2C